MAMNPQFFYLYLCVLALLLMERACSFKFSLRDASIAGLDLVGKGIYFLFSIYALEVLVSVMPNPPFLSVASIPVPLWLNATISFLLIDLLHYWLHRIHHQFAWLWRLHRLHHSDAKVDSLTTLLHHPLEGISGFFILISVYVLFDIPVPVILAYGFVFVLHAPLTHFSMYFPERINKWLSFIVVTPNFHKVHHSMDFAESNSNYGAVFSFWDHLFGTAMYRTKKQVTQQVNGLSPDQSPAKTTLPNYLINPFK
jgi:sterol desaturase/sphingolipid hydroxylase (fatty acid hydroxylase superfamily)